MKNLLRSMLAVLCLASSVSAALTIGPTVQSAGVDPTPAVTAINQVATSANAQITALNQQHAADQAAIAAQAQQLQQATAAAKPPATRPPAWLGMNSAQNDYFAFCRWADLTRNASPWYDDSNGSLPFTRTPSGMPVGANIKLHSLVYALGCPAGDYAVTWAGSGTISFGVWGGSYKSTGPNSGTITLPAPVAWTLGQWGWNPSESITITITRSDPAAPIDHLHIWRPGYGPGTTREGQLYCDEDLQMCRRFCCIRCMNDLRSSAVLAPKWANRVKLTDWDWDSSGPPVEAIIRRAQEAGVPALWVSVQAGQPGPDYDAYLTGLAQLLHDRYHGVLYVEGPNESWNSPGMVGWQVVDGLAGWNAATSTNGPLAGQYDGPVTNGKFVQSPAGTYVTDAFTRDARCAADLQKHVAAIFGPVYADRPGDLQVIFGGCAANPNWIQAGLSFLVARDGSQPFQAITIAPYVSAVANNGKYLHATGPNGTFSVDDVFAAANAFMADASPGGWLWQLQQHHSLAQQFGVKLLDYEGGRYFIPGAGTYASKKPVTDPNVLMQTDPRMGTLCDAMNAALHANSVALHCDFLPIAQPWDDNGTWGAMANGYSDMGNPACQWWQGLLRESAKSN